MESIPSIKFRLANLGALIWLMFLVLGNTLNLVYIVSVLSPDFYSNATIYHAGSLLAGFSPILTLNVNLFTLFAIIAIVADFFISHYLLVKFDLSVSGFHSRYLVSFLLLTLDSLSPALWFLTNSGVLSCLVVLSILYVVNKKNQSY